MVVTSKAVRQSLQQAGAKCGLKPKPWQLEAAANLAVEWSKDRKFLFSHPRGSGKTTTMTMCAYTLLRFLKQRVVVVVVDRCELLEQFLKTAQPWFERNAKQTEGVELVHCHTARQIQEELQHAEEELGRHRVLVMTLQLFPHVEGDLAERLPEQISVLADEAHRSHADKSLTDHLTRVTGKSAKLLMFTGTASARCVRLFGRRVERGASFVYQPFHHVSEDEVAKRMMIFGLHDLQKKFVEVDIDVSNIQKVATKHDVDPNVMDYMSSLANATSQAINLKAALFFKEFKKHRSGCIFTQQMMIVCDSRRTVLEYSKALKALISKDNSGDTVYAAFSGHLTCDETSMSEASYNANLHALYPNDPHKHANILVVCDRFFTGYDNSAVCLVAVDRKCTSSETLVQIYSRVNRRRVGKSNPLIIDTQNSAKDAQRALLEFSRAPEVEALPLEKVTALSENLCAKLAENVHDPDTAVEQLGEESEEERLHFINQLMEYRRCRAEGINRGNADEMLPLGVAEKLWNLLKNNRPSDITLVRKQSQALVEKHAAVRGLSISGCLAGGAPQQLTTPCKTQTATSLHEAALDDSTPEKTEAPDPAAPVVHMKAPRLDKLAAMGLDLEGSIAPCHEINLEETVDVEILERDIELLKKSRATLRTKDRFSALQRVVSATAEAQGSASIKALLDFGATSVLLTRLVYGDEVERQEAIRGLQGLAQHCTQARGAHKCVQDISLLLRCKQVAKFEQAAVKRLAVEVRTAKRCYEAQEKDRNKLKELKQELVKARDIGRDARGQSRVHVHRMPKQRARVAKRIESLSTKVKKQDAVVKAQASDKLIPALVAIGLGTALRRVAEMATDRYGSDTARAFLIDTLITLGTQSSLKVDCDTKKAADMSEALKEFKYSPSQTKPVLANRLLEFASADDNWKFLNGLGISAAFASLMAEQEDILGPVRELMEKFGVSLKKRRLSNSMFDDSDSDEEFK